jgi:hypothetical protein
MKGMTLSILTVCRSLNIFFFSQDRQLHLQDERDGAVDPHVVDHFMSSSFLRIGSSILRMKGMTLSILTLSIT